MEPVYKKKKKILDVSLCFKTSPHLLELLFFVDSATLFLLKRFETFT